MIDCCLMTDNKLDDEGAKVLSESLKVNTTLWHFNLWSFGFHIIDDERIVDEPRIDRQWDWTRRCQINFRIIEIEWQSVVSQLGK